MFDRVEMAIDVSSFLLLPGVAIGVIAGVVDLFFMIKDESGTAGTVISHGLGAFIPLIIFSIISINLGNFTTLPSLEGTFLSNEIGLRIALILFMAIYIHAKSALFKGAKGAGMSETWMHSLIIAIIVGLAPYLFDLLAPFLPTWFGGTG